MTQPLTTAALPLNTKFRELLDLLAALRDIREPLTTPEGLRASLELLLRLAEFTGVDRSWTDRVRTILDDPRAFDIVLAIVRYLQGLIATEEIMQILGGDVGQTFPSANPEDVGQTFPSANPGDVGQTFLSANPAKPEPPHAQDFLDWLPLILEIIALLRELRR
jgi:hypothetical protein